MYLDFSDCQYNVCANCDDSDQSLVTLLISFFSCETLSPLNVLFVRNRACCTGNRVVPS